MKDRIQLEINDGIADLRLARPTKLNALDPAMFKAIAEAGAQLSHDKSVRAVVLSGEGRGFCAGLDLDRMTAIINGEPLLPFADLSKRTHGLANFAQHIVWQWRELQVPVIAAVHGTYLMRSLAREDVVRELTYTARVFSAEEALGFGFVTRLVEDPHAVAMAIAREIASRSPDAIRAAKRLLRLGTAIDATALLAAERAEQKRLIGSANQVEAVRANLENRSPRFADPAPVGA
jgi:enoyl-CoA hydratase/carnithine racemase